MAELHLVATAFMAGLIVFVQVVHYPLMEQVGPASFVEYERQHTLRTGWVVVPVMLVELVCALWLFASPGGANGSWLAPAGLALLVVVWVSTALLQAPAHGSLVRGFDRAVHTRLVRTNWIRTVAWLTRLPIAVALVPSAAG